MLRRLRTVAGLALLGLVGAAACGDDAPSGPKGSGGGGGPGDGGEGGTGNAPAKAGSNSQGGRGGTNSGGKGGTASKAGSDAGGTAATAGAAGAAGAGGSPECPGCESGFCLDDGTCVDCLPSNDHCPSGTYCTSDNDCVAGCKLDGDGCASGACDNTHNCSSCISDGECIGDLVCGDGQCSAACTLAQEGQAAGCGDGLTCCSQHCTNVEVDSNHCGACGATCEEGEFCGLDACADGAGGAGGAPSAACVACHPVTIANVCSIARAIVILDTTANASDGNRAPGRAIGAALKAKCVPTPELDEAEQDSAGALNITSGRPVSGGKELLIVAGGPYYQHLEGYLEEQGIAPLYVKVTDTDTQFVKSSNDAVIVSLPIAGSHEAEDFFIIQFMRDPASGSLVLNAQGFWLSGTEAAAYQVLEGILPNLAGFTKAWYAYKWKDLDGDENPDLNEIVLIDSGP